MPRAHDIRLVVEGVEYLDIVSATLTRGLSMIADGLTLVFTDKWMRAASQEPLPFELFDPVEFTVDGEVALTGYIAALPRSRPYSGPMRFSMRVQSKAAHLVDCDHAGKKRVWKDADVLTIASDICEAFEIEVTTLLADLGPPLASFAAKVGEKACALIQRALKKRGLYAVSKPDGSLGIVEASSARYKTSFVGPRDPSRESNVLSIDVQEDGASLFSEYIVLGQSQRLPDWTDDGPGGSFAVATDPSVPVHRPLVLTDDSQGKKKDLDYRANWEMKARAGRSRGISLMVSGAMWDDKLIRPNLVMSVSESAMDVTGDFLAEMVVITFDANAGTSTKIDAAPPEAFIRESKPPNPKARSARRKGKRSAWA